MGSIIHLGAETTNASTAGVTGAPTATDPQAAQAAPAMIDIPVHALSDLVQSGYSGLDHLFSGAGPLEAKPATANAGGVAGPPVAHLDIITAPLDSAVEALDKSTVVADSIVSRVRNALGI